MPTRKNTSRSKELDIVKFTFKDNIHELKNYLIDNPNNSEYVFEDISFKYGNIERLIQDVDWDEIPEESSFENIKEIYHLDGISKKDKLKLEKKYNLKSGILTLKCKADLLVVANNNTNIISYKDSTVVAKLGQVSALVEYGQASLKGGLLLPLPPFNVKVTSYTQTNLSRDQFNKINQKDKNLAHYKKINSDKWDEFVKKSLSNAEDQLKQLSDAITSDRNVFLEFISKTFFGGDNIHENFKIVFGNEVISSDSILNFFLNYQYEITCEHYYTANKYSLIIKINVGDKIYGVTKIEPAFDGARDTVSQTKGIIYYFQQFPTEGLHIWQLLRDIPHYII